MALSFPLSKPAFMDKLSVARARFDAPTQRQVTGLGGGELLSAEVAPALWQGEVQLLPMAIASAAEIIGLLSALEVPGNTFFAYNPDRAGPSADSIGAALSGYSPTISAHNLSAGTITLANLPSGYVISPGDMISWSYGSSPVRYALHRFVEGGVASGGTTSALQVYPHLRPTIASQTLVTLVKPVCKALVVPGSSDFGETRGRTVHGISFRFRQTLR